jgi:CubicO group peptidase (beta-lactamase class C family)
MNLNVFRLITLIVILCVAPLFIFAQNSADFAAKIKAIDEYAEKARQDWNVPGLAIAIVKDDKILLTKGYGVRELGKPEKIDENTLFAIASNSKAFTTAALAILADEGKLKWDDKVSQYLPEFQLSDPYVTREITVRDLVSHRSGLATFGGDLLWYETNYTPDQILNRIRYLKPTSSFRSRYGYQNVMFIAAGKVIEKVSGMSWGEFVKTRILVPLNMNNTTVSIRDFKLNGNIATPHNLQPETENLRVIRYGNVDGAAAAAGINSSAVDLANWLRLHLNRGKFGKETGSQQIFSEKQSWEMQQPNIAIPISENSAKFNPTRHFNLYGLGWFLNDYNGRKMVSHGGALDGMLSQTAMLPEENLGIVVLTNAETPVYTAIVNRAFDVFLNVPTRDWSAEILARVKQGKAAEAEEKKKIEAQRALNTKPSLQLAGYTGAYGGAMYGDAKVTEENGKLVVRLAPSATFVGDLEHWHYDTFRIKWRDSIVYPFPRGFVTFVIDENGKPSEMKIDVPNPDFDFKELEFKRLDNQK